MAQGSKSNLFSPNIKKTLSYDLFVRQIQQFDHIMR